MGMKMREGDPGARRKRQNVRVVNRIRSGNGPCRQQRRSRNMRSEVAGGGKCERDVDECEASTSGAVRPWCHLQTMARS